MRRAIPAAATAVLLLAACQKQPTTDAAASATANAASASAISGVPAATQSAAALGQAADGKGELRMEVTEATRSAGVLTVKARFVMTGGKAGVRPLPGSSTDQVYLTAADKKYMLLKDDHDKPLMSSELFPNFDQVGASRTWWGKFPAPAPEVKAVNFYFSGFDPVENVALTDR